MNTEFVDFLKGLEKLTDETGVAISGIFNLINLETEFQQEDDIVFNNYDGKYILSHDL